MKKPVVKEWCYRPRDLVENPESFPTGLLDNDDDDGGDGDGGDGGDASDSQDEEAASTPRRRNWARRELEEEDKDEEKKQNSNTFLANKLY